MSEKRFPNLGKLSIAILENYVSNFVGSATVQELKSPYVEHELRESLAKALNNTEKRFITSYSNSAVTEALINLPIADVSLLKQAVESFAKHPTGHHLSDVIQNQLSIILPVKEQKDIERAANQFVKILREELVAIVPATRDVLTAVASISTEQHLEHLSQSFDTYLKQLEILSESTFIKNAPPPPRLVIGRDNDLENLLRRIGAIELNSQAQITTTIIRGLPGVGKTTLTSVLANSEKVFDKFSDGVLWTSLDSNPDILSLLNEWGQALGINDAPQSNSIETTTKKIISALHNKKMLLIVDDVWKAEHAAPFKVGGAMCSTIFTTRFDDVAQYLANAPDDIYKLSTLDESDSLKLLETLAPSVVYKYPKESIELVNNLEGLPLGIQVAGRLIANEMKFGWDINDLLAELNAGKKILEAKAPIDRTDLETQTIPTVAILLRKSIDTLTPEDQFRFACLGAFAPKPATFDIEALSAIWQTDNPKQGVRILVERGLLESLDNSTFQMHALLVLLAESLLN